MNIRLLEGEIENDADAQISALKDELADVRRALKAAQVEARLAREDGAKALMALRRQLTPLYRALQAVFGELDAAGVEDAPEAGRNVDARTVKIWESWKQRLGSTCAKAIDALLLQNDMNTQQLAIAVGISRQHASNIISKLNTTGLINKNGGRISLKKL